MTLGPRVFRIPELNRETRAPEADDFTVSERLNLVGDLKKDLGSGQGVRRAEATLEESYYTTPVKRARNWLGPT